MKKRFRKNKRGALTVVGAIGGLILVGIVILIISGIIGLSSSWLIELIRSMFDPNPGPTYLASPANFDRLNEEIRMMLDDQEVHSYKVIPYTLGLKYDRKWVLEDKYILVGFNRDKGANDCITDQNLVIPNMCNQEGVSCLCLCTTKTGCDIKDCQIYEEVDYFIGHEKSLHVGESMQGVKDPITNRDAMCLEIRGEHTYTHGRVEFKWGSKNLFIEKYEDYSIDEDDPTVFVFMAMADDNTEMRQKDPCGIAYNYEHDCVAGELPTGDKCLPSYDSVGEYEECKFCPKQKEYEAYKKNWLIIKDPCEYADKVSPAYECDDYNYNKIPCAFGRDKNGNRCVPHYDDAGDYDFCQQCPQECSFENIDEVYGEDWLAGVNPCGCTLSVESKNDCIEYYSDGSEYACAFGRDKDGDRCVPTYSIAGQYMGCEACYPSWCDVVEYGKNWLIAEDPCGCIW